MYSKADIHIHTNFSDGLNEPEAVINYVLTQTDLRVIAITDHNTIDGARVAYDYWHAHRHDFRQLDIIKGVEVSSAQGHILALFIEEEIPMNMSAAETVRAIHEQGGLAVAAHPFTHLLPFTDFHGIGRLIGTLPLDGVEARSSVPTEIYANVLTAWYNRRHARHATLGSSDAHYLTMVGKTFTLFPGETAADFRRAVERKQVHAGGRVNGPMAVLQVMLHLIRQRQWPVFLPNDQHYRHAGQNLMVDVTELRPFGAVLYCQGQLVRSNAHLLKQEGGRLLDGGRPFLILDFAQIDFVDSAGLGAIVALQKRARQIEGIISLCSLTDNVWRSLQLVRLDRVFSIYPTPAQAIAALPRLADGSRLAAARSV